MSRWPLYAAIVYVAAVVIGLFVVPAAPGVGASGATLVGFYRAHAHTVRLGAWLGAVSLIPLALLLAHLRTFIHGVGRDVAMFGAIGLFAGTTIWIWLGAGLALHPDSLQPNVARTVADVAAFFGPVLTVAIILIVAPLTAAAWRGVAGLPRWLAVLSVVFVIEQSVETITVFGTRGFIAPGGDMNFTLGAGLFLVWVLAAGAAAPPRNAVPV